jgi:hypothetical protein
VLSFVLLVIVGITARWYPQTAALLAVGTYAAFLSGVAVFFLRPMYGSGEFGLFPVLLAITVLTLPTLLFLLLAVIRAFRKSDAPMTWKQKLGIVGGVIILLACVMFKPTVTLIKLLRVEPRLGAAGADFERQQAVYRELADEFSTDELRLMAGTEPKHYLHVPLNGYAEQILGVKNTPESIAALESLLAEAEKRMKQGAKYAEQDRDRVIWGLALAPDYDYASLWDRYARDGGPAGVVVVSYMLAHRSDCDQRLLEYYRKHCEPRPDSSHTEWVADYLRGHGFEIE